VCRPLLQFFLEHYRLRIKELAQFVKTLFNILHTVGHAINAVAFPFLFNGNEVP